MGTYLHGAFGSGVFRRKFLNSLGVSGSGENYRESIEAALDELALGLENCLDIDALFSLD